MVRVQLTGRLVCRDLQEAEIVEAHLPAHVALTRAESGCLLFHVVRTLDPLVWHVDELYSSREAFAAHQARGASSAWGRATVGITRRYEVAELPDD